MADKGFNVTDLLESILVLGSRFHHLLDPEVNKTLSKLLRHRKLPLRGFMLKGQ